MVRREMLHFNKLHALVVDGRWGEGGGYFVENPTGHKETTNSISRNNDRNQKTSLKCKMQQDVAPFPPLATLNIPSCTAITQPHSTSFSLTGFLLYTAGVRLATSTALCLLCSSEPRIKWAICELLSESVRRSVPNRPQLSSTGELSAGFHLLPSLLDSY